MFSLTSSNISDLIPKDYSVRFQTKAGGYSLSEKIKVKKAIVIIIGLVVLVGVFGYLAFTKSDKSVGGTINNYFGSTSSVSHEADTTTQIVLASDAGRQYVKCSNMGPKPAYVAYDPVAKTSIGSFYLAVSSSFEITPSDMYFGDVSAITMAASTSISCIKQ